MHWGEEKTNREKDKVLRNRTNSHARSIQRKPCVMCICLQKGGAALLRAKLRKLSHLVGCWLECSIVHFQHFQPQ